MDNLVIVNILGMSAQFYWQIESGYINPTLNNKMLLSE